MKRTRILAGAVALAAGFAGFSADASAAVAVVGTMQGDQEMKNAAADAEEIRRVDAQTAAENAAADAAEIQRADAQVAAENAAAAKAQMKDARVEAWEAKRPEERKIDEEAKIADGKTIADAPKNAADLLFFPGILAGCEESAGRPLRHLRYGLFLRPLPVVGICA